VKGLGASWVAQINNTYDVPRLRNMLTSALTETSPGPRIIVASSECMLNKQRRTAPERARALEAGRRLINVRYGVDEELCSGDHACIRLSGCPSLTVVESTDPLKDRPVAAIESSCVGCGNCGGVAEAAALCPSFYRVETIRNPSRIEKVRDRVRGWIIRRLQDRRERRRPAFAEF
jgi:indolepyruvate ferredoxin oxidoreductase alpha subunit